MIMSVPPKQVSAASVPQQAVIIYSDAEYEPDSGMKPKLGWVLIPPDGSAPIGHAMELPEAIWKTWSHRHQQIFPAESVVLAIATWALHPHLRDKDVVWFIDNEAAASCAIRGCSSIPEVETAVQAAHILWLALGCRVWIEWIDSKSNPSDGLSRLGLRDPWTLQQNWRLSMPCDPHGMRTLIHPVVFSRPSGKTLGNRRAPIHWGVYALPSADVHCERAVSAGG